MVRSAKRIVGMVGMATLLLACNPPMETTAPATGAARQAAQPASAAPAAPPAATPPRDDTQAAAVAPTPPSAATGHAVDGAVSWLTWDQAHTRALAEAKPMMVFVYTDWCPRCRELEPAFSTAELQAATEGVLLVRYNSDDNAAWMRDVVGNTDTYVPRVLFLNPDGSLKPLVSPHPRFPYFYTAQMVQALVNNLQSAKAG